VNISKTLLICDRSRLVAFAAVHNLRRLMLDSDTTTVSDGTVWHTIKAFDTVVAVNDTFPGWWFDPFLRRHKQADGIESQRPVSIGESNVPVHTLLGSLHFGDQSVRLLWLIHQRVLQTGYSSLTLADRECAAAIWGPSVDGWPRHWRGDIQRCLDSLTRLHVSSQTQSEAPSFGENSALLVHAEDLRGKGDRDRCKTDCILRQHRAHHHYTISIGRGFLGVLEECATSENEFGVRTYDFFDRKVLRRLGRRGMLGSVFLPAKLGDPTACKSLTQNQHRLLQSLVQETTRNRKSSHIEATTLRVFQNGFVPDFSGKSAHCPLLRAESTYIVFGGNGFRPGRGYLVCSEGGWCKKAGYDRRNPVEFIADLIAVADQLNLTIVGATARSEHWLSAADLLRFLTFPRGRRIVEAVHLRIYASHDCWDHWPAHFGWSPFPTQPDDEHCVERIALALSKANIRQCDFAAQLEVDPSLLSRYLSGSRRMPVHQYRLAAQILRLDETSS